MNKRIYVLFFVVVAFLATPLAASALGLDVTVQAGGGAAMGTSDDENKSGELRWAAGGGMAAELYLLELKRAALGISCGVGYIFLNYYGITEDIPIGIDPFITTRTSESRYSYLNIPLTLVGMYTVNEKLDVTVKAGIFAGYFLGGKVDNSYSTEWAPFFVNGEVDLDETNTEQWQYGLSFSIGADLFKQGRFSFFPSIQFDIGLTDTSINNPIDDSKDTFWSLTANIGIRYSLF